MVATHNQQTALKLLVDLLLKWERLGGGRGKGREGWKQKGGNEREGESGERRVGGEGGDWEGECGSGGRRVGSRKSGIRWEIGKSEEERLGKGMSNLHESNTWGSSYSD